MPEKNMSQDRNSMSDDTKRKLLEYQRNEITEHHIYRRLARMQKSTENRRILEDIAADEKRHYDQWKTYTGADAPVSWTRVRIFCWIARIFGLTFKRRFLEMAGLSLGIAGLSFLMGLALRTLLGVEV